VFYVRAVDRARNPDPTPAAATFTLDGTAPRLTVRAVRRSKRDTGPRRREFAISSSERPVSLACRVDARRFAPCTSPYTTMRLHRGRHVLAVRGTDAAGNASAPVRKAFRTGRHRHRHR
jgi:hypothetical protein